MTETTGPNSDRRLGRLLLGALVFVLFVPVGLVALPLAALLLMHQPAGGRERVLFMATSIIGAYWLLGVGEIPEQTVRALALLGAVSFAVLTRSTRLTTVDRGLAATFIAFLGVGISYAALGLSVRELVWTLEHRIGMAARQVAGSIWTASDTGDAVPRTTVEVLRYTEELLQGMAHFIASNAAALFALELLGGFAVAAAIYGKLSDRPRGVLPGRFRDFRFSEHVGWLAVLGLVGTILPKLAAFKVVAANLLVLTAGLYALRGLAVMTFVGNAAGGSFLLVVVLTLATVFMLPLVVGGAIVMGILDTGLDIRKRWANPPARG